MKLGATILTAIAWAVPSWADTMCVGSGFNIPVPGATEVERRIADIASARVAGLWQEGRINGLPYRVYSNRTGMVADDLIRPNWRIDLYCDLVDAGCRRVVTGSQPDMANLVADDLELCLSGAPLTAPDIPTRTPSAQASILLENIVVEPAVPIESETVPELRGDVVLNCDGPLPTDVNELVREAQTMLTQIGFDPGPADGLLGPLTISALREGLGPSAGDLSPFAAVTALREVYCPS